MSEQGPIQRTMKFTDARAQLSSVVNEVFKEGHRVVIEKNGIPVAALVPATDLSRLAQADAARAVDLAVISEIAAAFADQSMDEIERQTALSVARVRADRRERAAS